MLHPFSGRWVGLIPRKWIFENGKMAIDTLGALFNIPHALRKAAFQSASDGMLRNFLVKVWRMQLNQVEAVSPGVLCDGISPFHVVRSIGAPTRETVFCPLIPADCVLV
jgi:hypothetical protein